MPVRVITHDVGVMGRRVPDGKKRPRRRMAAMKFGTYSERGGRTTTG